MTMIFEYYPGATPLDPDELSGLIPSHITTREELDRWEQDNILEADVWAFRCSYKNVFTIEFIKLLHKKMFGNVWKWAGTFRKTEKNIGVLVWEITSELTKLCDDVQAWIEYKSFLPDEIVVRFHHRLVWIHPFANGNGRHARMMADIILVCMYNATRFTWGGDNLIQPTECRQEYIQALRSADNHNYEPLMRFVRS